MDNKITRRRLYDFLSYEWILMIVIVLVSIIAWEIIFTMTRVTLTTGQDFLFFYDEGIATSNAGQTYTLFNRQDKDGRTVFSYDVLKIGHEELLEEYNVLQDRMSIQEGDVIITHCSEPEQNDETQRVRAKTIIDTYKTYDYVSLKEDAEAYLASLLKDGLSASTHDVADYNNLDQAKIEKLFRDRMKGDNRYRSESQKQEGIALEKERIADLCFEVKRFRILLEQGDEYFMMYTRYDQVISLGVDDGMKEQYDKDSYRLKGERPYGLKVEALSGDDKQPVSKYFRKDDADNAKDIVILVFDLKEYQPHLQFEAIAFINAIVENCSNLYDGIVRN